MTKTQKSCQNCPNKFLCPTYNVDKPCMGWGDRELFIGLLKLFFIDIPSSYIDERMEAIEKAQNIVLDKSNKGVKDE